MRRLRKINCSCVHAMPESAASDDSDYDSDKNYDTIRSRDNPFICGVVEGNHAFSCIKLLFYA